MNKPHKHAALMLQYAQDAAETETPWERWEIKADAGWMACDWMACDYHPFWAEFAEYRRKPRTINININGFEVPEPLREKPEDGTEYYLVDLPAEPPVTCLVWSNDKIDNCWLSSGICHLTSEAAEIHAKALISLTKQ